MLCAGLIDNGQRDGVAASTHKRTGPRRLVNKNGGAGIADLQREIGNGGRAIVPASLNRKICGRTSEIRRGCPGGGRTDSGRIAVCIVQIPAIDDHRKGVAAGGERVTARRYTEPRARIAA